MLCLVSSSVIRRRSRLQRPHSLKKRREKKACVWSCPQSSPHSLKINKKEKKSYHVWSCPPPPPPPPPVIRRRPRVQCPPWLTCHLCSCPQSSGEDPAFGAHPGSNAASVLVPSHPEKNPPSVSTLAQMPRFCSCPQSSGEDPAFSAHLGSNATFLFLSPEPSESEQAGGEEAGGEGTGEGGGGRSGRRGGKKTPGGRPTKLPACSLPANMTPTFYVGGGNGVAL